MKQAAVLSAVVHLLFIMMMVFGLPSSKTPDFEIVSAIPVELLTMAEIAQSPMPSPMPTAQKAEKVVSAKSTSKALPPESLPVPEPLPKPEIKPEPEPVKSSPPQPVPPDPIPEQPVPPVVVPVLKPVPEPEQPEPKSDLKQDFEALQSIVKELANDTTLVKAQEIVAESDPKPKVEEVQPKSEVKETVKPEKSVVKSAEKPKAKPVIENPKDDSKDKKAGSSFNSVLKNIAKLKSIEQGTEGNDNQSATSKSSHANQMGPALTEGEINAVRQQIESVWSINPGARNIEQMVIVLEIWVNPDRTVRDVRVVPDPELAHNPFYRSLRESAIRAVKDPRCNPLRLPANQYERWKYLKLNFRPPV